jgi:hypothetical protein
MMVVRDMDKIISKRSTSIVKTGDDDINPVDSREMNHSGKYQSYVI